ncbi:putative Mn2+ efflux pump MntP [Salsuginibacillus halophilus]|uniref:Putative Mn2+ efflux pump MntP n=1 Tax=Salsuginibacillus halophilus TaxID=517424 RepID=A0A2P8HXC7_9BACI|nr:manganese efflux pump [Salsuginibacillus halophilus]PSL50872.1 putative Mn2+ efflux pump MntP [Salsuginibacillus halophilus]
MWIEIIVLALAASADNLAVGTAYGVQRKSAQFRFILAVGLVSGAAFIMTAIGGRGLREVLPLTWAEGIAAAAFILIGLYSLYQVYVSNQSTTDDKAQIEKKESVLLVFILSLDALLAGAGAGMQDYPIVSAALIMAFAGALSLLIGFKAGEQILQRPWLARFSYLPGVVLIVYGSIGVLNLL